MELPPPFPYILRFARPYPFPSFHFPLQDESIEYDQQEEISLFSHPLLSLT